MARRRCAYLLNSAVLSLAVYALLWATSNSWADVRMVLAAALPDVAPA